MLSKLFTSARTLLDRSSQISSSELRDTGSAPEPASRMVTTRRQSGHQAIDRSDDAQATPQVSSSSRKRQVPSSDSEDTKSEESDKAVTPASKKQKVLPVRARNTRVVVEIPVSNITPDHASFSNSSRRESGKRSHTSEDIESADGSTSHQSRLEIPDSESEAEMPEIKEDTKNPDSSDTRQAHADVSKALPSAPKAKHRRFGSDESDVVKFPTAVEQDESEDESSDDDAPEVVGAQDALEKAKRKELDAAKAIEERESAVRKKRKERDAILKQQASNKRKREQELEPHPKKSGPKPSREDNDNDDEKAGSTIAATSTLKLGPDNRLPEFLPEEFLEDGESEDEMAVEAIKRPQKAKRTKFTELIDQKPKDIRRGSTTYRVAEARSTNLAPKSSLNARSVKESWQRGRVGSNRKAVSTGFFKKR